jgi:succinate dehydrogenase flavin-adding protein (antitoxin of CptAB toxin-antitoxin module)
MQRRPTAGELAIKAMLEPNKVSPFEAAKGFFKDYWKSVEECISTHKKMAVFKDNDFFVVVLTKKERLLQPLLRQYFVGTLACPIPNYDQTIYKYHKGHDAIEFVWTIPDRETCKYFLKYPNLLTDEEKTLLPHIIAFKDNELYKKMKELNNEEADNPKLRKMRE